PKHLIPSLVKRCSNDMREILDAFDGNKTTASEPDPFANGGSGLSTAAAPKAVEVPVGVTTITQTPTVDHSSSMPTDAMLNFETAAKDKRYCPNCKAEMNNNYAFCLKCGKSANSSYTGTAP
ncbi:MAG: hypothetical protein ACRD3W_00995, partial [Terriglobales bacterium]